MSTHEKNQKGFTLLIAVLISSVVLAIGLSILNVTLKQYIFSNIGRESEIAFYAADAGMECALYWDASSQGGKFGATDASGQSQATPNFACMGGSVTNAAFTETSSRVTYTFERQWGVGQTLCAKMTVIKYYSTSGSITMDSGNTCAANTVCTEVESRGYNRGCSVLTSNRTVERALRALY